MIRCIITCGDPNGIGLEVCIKALMRYADIINGNIPSVYFFMENMLKTEISSPMHLSLAVHQATFWEYVQTLAPALQATIDRTNAGFRLHGLECTIVPCTIYASVQYGKEMRESGALSWESLRVASQTVREGRADAVVTMPVSKHALRQSGFPFPGQTEFFADECRTEKPLMVLATEAAEFDHLHAPVRVGLVTVHIPLGQVAAAISRERVLERIYTMNSTLQQDFAIASPRIAVLGLNPHAGENGDIGSEDRDYIAPAVAAAQENGIVADGPFPADGFFAHGAFRRYDGIVAMYHDQGLIPLKLLAGNGGVNFSAGLPIVRTSPDHGTAFALAGKGLANENSALEALLMASQIVRNRRRSMNKHYG